MKVRSLALALVLVLALSACGGGGGYGGSRTGPVLASAPILVQGIYYGYGSDTLNGTQNPVAVFGAIDSGGFAYFVDSLGNLYVLPVITDTGSVSGMMTAYAPPGQTFQNGQSVVSFAVTVTTSANGVFMTVTFSQSNESGTFQLNYEPLSLSRITVSAGSYQGFYWGNGGNTAIAITVNPNDTFSGTDGFGCQISGTMTPIPGFNLFTVTASLTGQAVCAGSVSGLGFAGTDDLTGQFGGVQGVYFYIGASNAQAGLAAEFKSQ
ncbi:MAG: hypothetical protein ACYDB9_09780 [Gammaproteobacteria bacterium]